MADSGKVLTTTTRASSPGWRGLLQGEEECTMELKSLLKLASSDQFDQYNFNALGHIDGVDLVLSWKLRNFKPLQRGLADSTRRPVPLNLMSMATMAWLLCSDGGSVQKGRAAIAVSRAEFLRCSLYYSDVSRWSRLVDPSLDYDHLPSRLLLAAREDGDSYALEPITFRDWLSPDDDIGLEQVSLRASRAGISIRLSLKAVLSAMALIWLDEAVSHHEIFADAVLIAGTLLALGSFETSPQDEAAKLKEVMSELSAKGVEKRHAKTREVRKFAVERYLAGKWASANDAAHRLQESVLNEARRIGANLSSQNAQRTLAEWFRAADRRGRGG